MNRKVKHIKIIFFLLANFINESHTDNKTKTKSDSIIQFFFNEIRLLVYGFRGFRRKIFFNLILFHTKKINSLIDNIIITKKY